MHSELYEPPADDPVMTIARSPCETSPVFRASSTAWAFIVSASSAILAITGNTS